MSYLNVSVRRRVRPYGRSRGRRENRGAWASPPPDRRRRAHLLRPPPSGSLVGGTTAVPALGGRLSIRPAPPPGEGRRRWSDRGGRPGHDSCSPPPPRDQSGEERRQSRHRAWHLPPPDHPIPLPRRPSSSSSSSSPSPSPSPPPPLPPRAICLRSWPSSSPCPHEAEGNWQWAHHPRCRVVP